MKICILVVLLFSCCVQSQAVTYSCCFFQNNYESSVSAVSCTNQYCPDILTGWTKTGLKQTTNCYFCPEHMTEFVNSTKLGLEENDDVNIHESEDFVGNYQEKRIDEKEYVDEDEKEYVDGLYTNYQCCLYSSPESSYYWPIYTFNSNPNSGNNCPSSLYGETFLGSWYTNSLYNQCYFILRY
jgi:hypothetical protein